MLGRPILRVARPEDWTGTLARLAVVLAFVLLMILVPLVPLPAAWVALAWGYPLVLRACMVLAVVIVLAAAHSVLGRPPAIQKNRGRVIRVSDDTQVLVTVHPSYLLRVPEEKQAEEYRRFVDDLAHAAQSVSGER